MGISVKISLDSFYNKFIGRHIMTEENKPTETVKKDEAIQENAQAKLDEEEAAVAKKTMELEDEFQKKTAELEKEFEQKKEELEKEFALRKEELEEEYEEKKDEVEDEFHAIMEDAREHKKQICIGVGIAAAGALIAGLILGCCKEHRRRF
jgi:DNA anti-recombination protein RmuC